MNLLAEIKQSIGRYDRPINRALAVSATVPILYCLSFIGYLHPTVNQIWFIVLLGLMLMITVANWRWGLVLVLLEAIINSKGYLFALSLGDWQLSLRIGFWFILMVVYLSHWLKNPPDWQYWRRSLWFWPLSGLALAVIIGLIRAIIGGVELSDLLFDINGWLYWLIILPWLEIGRRDFFQRLWPVLGGAIAGVSIVSLFLFYLFSHYIGDANLLLYAWLRDWGLAEITLMPDGFYRIFLQAQLWLLPALAVWLLRGRRKNPIAYYCLGAVYLAPLIISLSRSFWFGLAGLWSLFLLATLFKKINWLDWWRGQLALLSAAILALALLWSTVNFPGAKPLSDLSVNNLSKRAMTFDGEAGAASRWKLLPELWTVIQRQPWLGSGFGTTVTYYSADPRILENNPSGQYTTFAFEWGWLDIWLKTGLIGLLAYGSLFVVVLRQGYRQWRLTNDWWAAGLSAGALTVAAVHVFSPYLNHPLGIAYLALTMAYLSSAQESLASSVKI